jgi:predicted HAD superfamily Cof-like phosphohydrolase
MGIPFDNVTDVANFQKKFGHLLNQKPTHLTKRKLEERVVCMTEELNEFIDGINANDLAAQADALVDLVYFALGTANMLGLPWQDLWNDVQRANMAKVPGVTKRGHLVDCVKPEGWVGPKTLEILERHGYNKEVDSKEENHCDDAKYQR